MTTIYQEDGSTVAVTLRASESAAIADYFGTPGSITLHHLPTGTRYNVAVFEVESETPDVPSDVYRAEQGAATLLVGGYRVEASLTDLSGNRTVIGVVETPQVGDVVTSIEFVLKERRIRRWFRPRGMSLTTAHKGSDLSTRYRLEDV